VGRALVEQSIAHLANAWALRRWRGLLYLVQEVFRTAGALICSVAGCTESPHDTSIKDTLNGIASLTTGRANQSATTGYQEVPSSPCPEQAAHAEDHQLHPKAT
jgi:hypothetical protein